MRVIIKNKEELINVIKKSEKLINELYFLLSMTDASGVICEVED